VTNRVIFSDTFCCSIYRLPTNAQRHKDRRTDNLYVA